MDRNTPPRRLQGWKEIADYLGTSTRSAQRWNACLQLPVHRDKRIRGATVSAQADELDAWRLAHTEAIRQDDEEHGVAKSPQAAGGAGKPMAEPSDLVPASEVPPPVSIGGIEAHQPTTGNINARPPKTRSFPRWAIACLVGVVLAAVGLSWWVIFGSRVPTVPRPVGTPGSTSTTAYGVPVSGQRIVLVVRVGGDTASGEVLDGAMLTVARPGGRRIGIAPLARERGVDIVVFDIEARAGGAEAIGEIGRHHLSPGIPVVVDAVQGLSVELRGLRGKRSDSMAQIKGPSKTCCITCGMFTVCAPAVATACGSCDSEK